MTIKTLTFPATSSSSDLNRGVRAHLTKSNSTLVSAKDLGMIRDSVAGLVRKIQIAVQPNGNPALNAYR